MAGRSLAAPPPLRAAAPPTAAHRPSAVAQRQTSAAAPIAPAAAPAIKEDEDHALDLEGDATPMGDEDQAMPDAGERHKYEHG